MKRDGFGISPLPSCEKPRGFGSRCLRTDVITKLLLNQSRLKRKLTFITRASLNLFDSMPSFEHVFAKLVQNGIIH